MDAYLRFMKISLVNDMQDMYYRLIAILALSLLVSCVGDKGQLPSSQCDLINCGTEEEIKPIPVPDPVVLNVDLDFDYLIVPLSENSGKIIFQTGGSATSTDGINSCTVEINVGAYNFEIVDNAVLKLTRANTDAVIQYETAEEGQEDIHRLWRYQEDGRTEFIDLVGLNGLGTISAECKFIVD